MKTLSLKIFVATLFLFTFSASSQNSLGIKSKCDSLKAAYEAKVDEWREIETDFKALYEKYKTYKDSNIERYKPEYDSLFTLYNSRWEAVKSSNLIYLKCIDENAENNSYYSPPPKISEDEFYPDVQNKPELIKNTVELITNYIKENYPEKAKKDSIGGSVIVKFICSEEGVPTNLSILYEKPDSLGFGSVALEAIKLSRWEPAKDHRTGKPLKIRMSQKIIFKPKKIDLK